MEKQLQNFLETLKYERNYSDHTIKGYQEEILKFQRFLNEKKISYLKITKEQVRTYLAYLDQQHYENSSISRNISSLRSFYKYLEEMHFIKNNVFKRISNPKKQKKLPNFLSTLELESLFHNNDLKTPYEIRNRMIMELLYATGMRVSELINIKLSDIDFQEKNIRTMGKGKKERIVYFGDYAHDALKKYLKTARDELLNNVTSEYLLVGKNSTHLTRNRIFEIVNEEIERCGLHHHISPHVLRHTFATQLLNSGADIRSVQELLGHKNLSTTQVYTHITNDQLRKEYLEKIPRK